MCNQRERLIGFIYNEGDAAELREVHEHVEGCAECRAEIAALRSVREDLLAWDVPESESVWRPFQAAPVAQPVWWRQVPAWAMAAAAGVMLAGGFAGGAVAHGFAKETVVATTFASPVQQTSSPAATTPAELDKLRAEFRSAVNDLDARLGRVSAVPAVLRAELRTAVSDLDARIVRASAIADGGDEHVKLQTEVTTLRELNAKLIELVNGFDAQWDKVWRTVDMNNNVVLNKVRNLEEAVKAIASK